MGKKNGKGKGRDRAAELLALMAKRFQGGAGYNLPILGCGKIGNGELTINQLDTVVKVAWPESIKIEGAAGGKLVLLSELAKLKAWDTVEFEPAIKETKKPALVKMKQGKLLRTINDGWPIEDYPEEEKIVWATSGGLAIDREDWRRVLAAVPKRDPRKVLMGILHEAADLPGNFVMIATTGRTLAKIERASGTGVVLPAMIVPREVVELALVAGAGEEENCGILEWGSAAGEQEKRTAEVAKYDNWDNLLEEEKWNETEAWDYEENRRVTKRVSTRSEKRPDETAVTWIRVRGEGWEVVSRTIEGTYPAWRFVWPEKEKLAKVESWSWEFDRAELLAALKELSPYAEKRFDSMVFDCKTPGEITIKAQRFDEGAAETIIAVSGEGRGEHEFGVGRKAFSWKYLSEMAQLFESASVKLEGLAVAPNVITGDGEKDAELEGLVMSVRMTDLEDHSRLDDEPEEDVDEEAERNAGEPEVEAEEESSEEEEEG